MTKEQYFHNVQHNQGQLLYNMYVEKFDDKKHGPLLQPNEFMMYIQMSGMMLRVLLNKMLIILRFFCSEKAAHEDTVVLPLDTSNALHKLVEYQQ